MNISNAQEPTPVFTPSQASETSPQTKTIVTVMLLIFAYPIGLLSVWFWTRWPRWVKIFLSLPIIIAIIGIALSALLFTLNPYRQGINLSPKQPNDYLKTDKVVDTQILSDLGEIKSALELYRSDNNTYPDTISQLIPKYLPSNKSNPVTKKEYDYSFLGQNEYILSTQLSDGGGYTMRSP